MKIEHRFRWRILFEGYDLPLSSYHDDDNYVWYWLLYTKNQALASKGFSRDGEYFELLLKMDQKYPYSAYVYGMGCIYQGYEYDVENVWKGESFILYPSKHRTRKHLNLHGYDDSRLEIPYDDFIASSPTVWEVRSPIPDFIFDVEPFVFLYKDGAYIEENLGGPWKDKAINCDDD